MKRNKRKRTAVRVIIIILIALIALILAFGIACVSIFVSYYNKFKDPNAPEIIENTGTYVADIDNPEGLITGTGVPEDLLPEEDEVHGGIGDDVQGVETGEISNDTTAGNSQSNSSGNSSGSSSSGNSSGGSNYRPPAYNHLTTNYEGSIPIYRVDQKDPNIVNIIVVGRDANSYYGRADSAMVVSYNKKTNDVKIVSLLRDCYVPIEGHYSNKLGHALAYGGIGLYINTVNEILDLDIQHYIVLNFEGVEKIVDQLGGIDVTLTQREVDYYKGMGYRYTAGVNHLNGEQALAHCRNRSLSGADFERTRRQRDVVEAIYKKAFSMGLTDCIDVANTMSKYLKMNIPLSTCISVMTDVFTVGGIELEAAAMPFNGTWEYGYAKPPGYTGSMSVVKIDIRANRQKINEFIYG